MEEMLLIYFGVVVFFFPHCPLFLILCKRDKTERFCFIVLCFVTVSAHFKECKTLCKFYGWGEGHLMRHTYLYALTRSFLGRPVIKDVKVPAAKITFMFC